MQIETYSIPTSIKLLGIRYKINMSKDVIKSDDKLCLGIVNHKKRTIKLWHGNMQLQQTLFHELGHILNYLTKIGENECNNEIFAQTSSIFWCQVFQQIKFVELKHLRRNNGKRKTTSKK